MTNLLSILLGDRGKTERIEFEFGTVRERFMVSADHQTAPYAHSGIPLFDFLNFQPLHFPEVARDDRPFYRTVVIGDKHGKLVFEGHDDEARRFYESSGEEGSGVRITYKVNRILPDQILSITAFKDSQPAEIKNPPRSFVVSP